MKLKSLEYKDIQDGKLIWELQSCKLKDVNLFVGKNATGKTRTCHVINGLADLLFHNVELRYTDGYYFAVFDSDEGEYEYELEFRNKRVIKEILKVNKELRLNRVDKDKSELFYAEAGRMLSFGIEDNKIAVCAKRDSVQHPYLEALFQWAEGSAMYHFNSDLGVNSFAADLVFNEQTHIKGEDRVVEFFNRGCQHDSKFKHKIIEDFNSIGYNVEDIEPRMVHVTGISLTPGEKLPPQLFGLAIKEKDLDFPLGQNHLSTGMFRALAIIIHCNYVLSQHSPSLIVIDDIGEGLDFQRSKSLIKLLVSKFEGSECQLVLSSNDQFVMNAVSLNYWNIIVRSGNLCSVKTKENSPNEFQEFEFMGLNNFELLQMDLFS